jgi:hypothetical protein
MTTTTQTVNAYQLVTLAHGLALEIEHPGMKLTGKANLVTVAKRFGYPGVARKVPALVWACEIMLNNDLPVNDHIMKVLSDNGYELEVEA